VLPDALADASDEQIEAVRALLQEHLRGWRIRQFFPDEGPLRRELYRKHLAFFRAGAAHRERCFMAGNRVGKTIAGGYETTLHLTGRYPDWWEGRTFDKPIAAWAAGKTLETTRDIVQLELFGQTAAPGTGMIPRTALKDWKTRPNTNGALDFLTVRYGGGGDVQAGESILGFKSYDQGRKAFEGTAKHFIWLDEEPPQPIYNECLTRTATTKGCIAITFTPLEGATEVVMDFLENGELMA
jgi:phage terminase large subunit-like protein